jgi:hypothetical protein
MPSTVINAHADHGAVVLRFQGVSNLLRWLQDLNARSLDFLFDIIALYLSILTFVAIVASRIVLISCVRGGRDYYGNDHTVINVLGMLCQ